ncbi:MAG TPA: ABC transporter substrate-binding protein [Mycobacteriales bacterium]|nr:ABC transporter substrate-binding protein [Mycobacteriales bacterium]
MKLLPALVLTLVLLAGCGSGTTTAATDDVTPGVLSIAMTAADIPQLDTVLSSDQGYEGYRFVGFQLYDGLTRYDLDQSTRTPQVVPDLARSWSVSKDKKTWTFHLRQGVRFHDGTRFDADAVMFNLDRYLNPKSPAYYAPVAGYAGRSLLGVKSYRKTGAYTVQITTATPIAYLPDNLTMVFMASPAAVRKYGNAGFNTHPVGTGPFRFGSYQRGQQLTLLANKDYWRGAPKLTKLILRPVSDGTSRTAALRAGEVNWIEYPIPDDVPGLKKQGFRVPVNSYDHIWPWILNTKVKPWNDERVRQAVNYAIDRTTMSRSLLFGTAEPAYQFAPRANAGYRKANDRYSYNPRKARELLAEAGYPHGFTTTVAYPTSGSGNMEPGLMNQELQGDLAKVGIKIKLAPVEWATLLTNYVAGKMPMNAAAVNISLTTLQENSWPQYFSCASPTNLSHYCNKRLDSLLNSVTSQFDPAKRAATYAQIAKILTNTAPWLFVVNDRNPRAISPHVHGLIEPKSWFIDLTTVSVS